jgi:hypothetical protein
VLPSLLTALGVPGFAGPLAMPPARSACLLLLDGLGWELLAEHAADAPFLAGLAAGAEPLDAGFPATTATSITSVCTGLSPGEHGIVGYSFAVPELLNALSWRSPEGVDLRAAAEPEQVQPNPTVFERAAAAGVGVRVLLPAVHRRSGLTRAALRGAEYVGVHGLGDLTAGVLDALGEARSLCYAYFADLDLMGHRYGPGSTPWRCQLGFVDRLVEVIAQRLPRGALLAVVADHGMVALADPVDADTDPRLRCGVRLIGGDVRARHVYAEPGAAGDVLAGWREVLGPRAWVAGRAEAVAAGWFGPAVAPAVLDRIGDVVVAARDRHGVVLSAAEPRETAMVGHHGSLTPADQLVPLLLTQG